VTQTDPILRVRGLTTKFFTKEGTVRAVDNLDLEIKPGEIHGVVGESGSGKSVTALSIMDLVETPGRITEGQIWYRDAQLAEELNSSNPEAVDDDYVDLVQLSDDQRRRLRGSSFSMVFQDPMVSFNPSITVGEQIGEAVEAQRRANARPRSTRARTEEYGLGAFIKDTLLPSRGYVSDESLDRAVELLERVGIPDPEERAKEYPHQFSGGMLQRAMIAQALAGEPDLLIADEPTTALDVSIEAQILNLLKGLQEEQNLSIMIITHDLGVVARMCDQVAVMYAGDVVERGTISDVFHQWEHPYTGGLLKSVPKLDEASGQLYAIEGNVPDLIESEMEDECRFIDRCPKAMEKCEQQPKEYNVSETHSVKCYLADSNTAETTQIASQKAND